jgi:hypothetical protein
MTSDLRFLAVIAAYTWAAVAVIFASAMWGG